MGRISLRRTKISCKAISPITHQQKCLRERENNWFALERPSRAQRRGGLQHFDYSLDFLRVARDYETLRRRLRSFYLHDVCGWGAVISCRSCWYDALTGRDRSATSPPPPPSPSVLHNTTNLSIFQAVRINSFSFLFGVAVRSFLLCNNFTHPWKKRRKTHITTKVVSHAT